MGARLEIDRSGHDGVAACAPEKLFDFCCKRFEGIEFPPIFLYNIPILVDIFCFEYEANLAAIGYHAAMHQPDLVVVLEQPVLGVTDRGAVQVHFVLAVYHNRVLLASALRTTVDGDVHVADVGLGQHEVAGRAAAHCEGVLADAAGGEVEVEWDQQGANFFSVSEIHEIGWLVRLGVNGACI